MSEEQAKKGFGPWGWFMLIFGLLIFFCNGGFFADGTNIIAPAVAEKLGAARDLIMSMNSVAGIVGVIIAVLAGRLNQRFGPAKVTAGCLILAGLGHVATGNAVNVPMYLIAMICVGGGLSSGSFVGVGTLVANWFPRKQGQAMSVVAMGSNLGTVIFVPFIISPLVASLGVATSSIICGLCAAIVGCIGMALLRNTPQERGQYPDNVTEAEFKASYASAAPEEDPHGWTVGKLLRTKETWLCVFSTGLLMLVQMGLMTQLVARNTEEIGMPMNVALGAMSAVGVIGIIGSVIFGRIVFKLGIKKAGTLACLLYIIALLFNVTAIMPLVWVSLVIIGFLGAAAPNLMNSIPASVFGRVGYAKVNSVVFPITNIIYMLNFAVNAAIRSIFGSLRAAYILFAVLALVAMLIILAIQDHKYDQDYMAAHGKQAAIS